MKYRLLQWNCMYSENIGDIARLIKELDPDIICLQELTKGYDQRWPDTGRYIADYLNFSAHYAYGRMVLPDGRPAMMGNGIFSRYTMRDRRTIQVTHRTIESGGKVPDDRYYLQVAVDVPDAADRGLTVGTAHLPFHPQFATTPLAASVVDSILTSIPPQGEVLLMGDLNRTPNTQAARRLRQAGLRNVGPALNQPTWTTKPFAIGPWKYDALQWRLDYTLYRGGGRRLSAQVVQTDLSDHLPLLVELEI